MNPVSLFGDAGFFCLKSTKNSVIVAVESEK